ncbi:phasin family protein [Sphingomonas sp. NBWT7]|uniref:phasin family protein n=1 Tax=Sphingomonas sp. NBWT7 TaxID=2596913 RepID=UPI0021563856|nr:TIGR01841 family phasin [Sphingomonas sp. NBWT7]
MTDIPTPISLDEIVVPNAEDGPSPVPPVLKAPTAKPATKKPALAKTAAPAPEIAADAQPVAEPNQSAAPAVRRMKEFKMVETIEMMTDKTKTAFADVNERAKASMEKGARALEDVAAFNKGNIEAIVESSKIAAKGMEQMGQNAAAYAKTSFDHASSAFKSMTTVKSPTELFKLQSDYARSSFDAFVAEASRSTEAALKLAGEIAQPISNRVALAAEKIKVAA